MNEWTDFFYVDLNFDFNVNKNILEGQTAPGLEREPEMNFNLNVQTFRLITEGYILVSDDSQ